MHSAVLAVAVGILVIVAYEDVRARRIPDALSLASILPYGVAVAVAGVITLITAR
jgi:Flp pilus assembly protein protease CpaA